MAEPADALLLRAVEEKENAKWTASGSGRRVGCLSHGRDAKTVVARGQRGQTAGDGWRYVAVDF